MLRSQQIQQSSVNNLREWSMKKSEGLVLQPPRLG